MKRIGKFGAALLLLVLTTACTTNVGSFAMISNKNLDLSKKYEKTNDVIVGKQTLHIIVVFPTGNPDFYTLLVEAVTNAVETNGIDYLRMRIFKTHFGTSLWFSEKWKPPSKVRVGKLCRNQRNEPQCAYAHSHLKPPLLSTHSGIDEWLVVGVFMGAPRLPTRHPFCPRGAKGKGVSRPSRWGGGAA